MVALAYNSFTTRTVNFCGQIEGYKLLVTASGGSTSGQTNPDRSLRSSPGGRGGGASGMCYSCRIAQRRPALHRENPRPHWPNKDDVLLTSKEPTMTAENFGGGKARVGRERVRQSVRGWGMSTVWAAVDPARQPNTTIHAHCKCTRNATSVKSAR